MGTCTELFGVVPVPVKASRRMERVHGNKQRALIFGYPTRDTDTSATTINATAATTIPIKTCWVIRQQEQQQPVHHFHQHQRLQCQGENHRNVNSRLSNKSSTQNPGYDQGDNYDCSRRTVRAPSVCQFPSHVFRESSLIFLIIISIFSSYLIRPGNGLHPPQCQWSLHQDIERLNCLVETGNSLIVEEEVHGIGPEHAKSLWVQCSSTFSDILPGTSGSSANVNGRTDGEDSSYFSPSSSALGTEGVQEHPHHHHHHQSAGGASSGGFALSHGVFMAVPNLRDLRIENCKISGITPGALTYLPYLQNLTLRSHTSLTSWPSSSSLEIKTGVLRGLPELRYLDLSTTSLSSLPNDFLCFLPSLEHLNLTSCQLRDFQSTGIVPSDITNPQNCGTSIKVLDLSANHFTLLPPATFASVYKLEQLRIERNSITIAAERALLSLTSLKILSLSGNQLTSLPPEFFKDNRQLQEIYLQNNSLSVLAPGLFTGLKNLVVLDLSNNELTSEWVNGDTFRGLDNLFALNLAYNDLSKIDSLMFRDLRFLQMLNLENNKIHTVAEDAFIGMHNMYTLVLSHNHLKKVSSICNGLFGLSFLSLDNNKIELSGIEADSFKNCTGLQDLNLSGNKLVRVPQALSVLTHLRTLDLGENQITNVSNASYQGLPALYGLRLTDNSIGSIEESFNLPALKIVNLAKNNITAVSPGVFDNNANTQAIRLDSNKLRNITGLFKNIPNLLWLNLSANELDDELKYEEFPQRLQWLDLRSNKIRALGNCMDLDNLRIRNLDLSDNYITEVGSSNLPDSIENLILGHNQIHHIQPYTFYRKNNLSRVDISHNELTRLDQNALRLGPDRVAPIAEIFLGHNPLQCDCSMEWLQNMNSDETSGQYPIIQDVADVKCTLSFNRQHEPVSFLSIQPSQFLCKYESHCFKTCQCCEYDACDCKMQCPKNCTCYHDQAWTSNIVECSMLEQNFIPGRIPMDSTQLYLDGNVLTSLDSHAFIGRKNLKALYLNASHIESIQNRTFHGLKALKTLDLHGNFIERLEGFEFEDLENLEHLYLHQNSIEFIANNAFSSLYRLKVLTLHENNLVDFPVWQVTTRIGRLGYTLMEITLRGNEFSCECQFATTLRDWLIENRAKISDASQVHCVDQVSSSTLSSSSHNNNVASNNQVQHSSGGSVVSNGQQNRSQTELVVVRLLDQKNHRCTDSSSSQSTDLSILEPTKSTESDDDFHLAEYVPWLVCITGLVIVLILLSVLSYYWRQSLRVWFHSHCGLRLGSCREPPTERDKLFDAFVSYSSKDEAWVRQVLAAELERNDPPYRLCLRYRDLPTGGTYLADTIVQASEASKRTILVLSHHFLKGEWSRTDVKSAHHSVLKDRHRKVIIILLGDLPSKELDQDCRLYLKNHTCLKCDESGFWSKLYFALPDVKKPKVPVFRGINGRTSSSRNNSQHRPSPAPAVPPTGPPQQPQNHHHLHHAAAAAAHHHHYQTSPNLNHQAHHLTHLGPNTHNNITSPLMGPPPPLTAPPNLNIPPNILNGTMGHTGHPHHSLHGNGPVTTVIGGNGGIHHGGSSASISTSSNNSLSQRPPQRHHLVNNTHHPNSRQNTAINI